MKHFVLLLLLFALSGLSVLPAQEIVQLEERLKNIKEDLNKVPVYMSLARAYRKRKEYQRAVENYFQARNILTKNGREPALANTLDELGLLYQEWNGYETSIKYFLGADSLHARNGQIDSRLLSLENAAWSFYQIKKYAEARNIYEQALPLYRQQNKPEVLALALNRLALMYQLNGEPEKALPYVEEELRLYQNSNNENGQIQALNNLAFLQRALKDRRKSFQYFNEAIALNQKKLDKALNNAEQASLLTNLGVINTNLRNYPEAEDYFQKALRIWETAQRLDRQADMHNHLALNHCLRGSIEKARPEVEMALTQAKASGNKIAERDSYRILADISEAEGDLKAFRQYSEKLNALSKEIDDRENQKRQALINQQLALQQMEGEIALGISRDENQKLELEQQKLIAQRAEKDRRVAELTAAQAEKDRQLAYERALRAENDRSLAIAREQKSRADAQTARAEKSLALAEAERNRAQAEKDSLKALEADRNRKLAEAEARQARSEKERLEQEQSQRNARNVFLAIIGFFGLIILFILFFYYKNRQKNRLLKAQNEKIQEQNVSLEHQKAEIEAQRDNLIELNEEINQQKEEIEAQRDVIEREKVKSDELLLNILPYEVAVELKERGQATPRHYDLVTVLFTDFKGFTNISAKLTPEEVIHELDRCFQAFDEIIGRYNLEKIKTIGDAYMCAGGIPIPNTSNPVDAVRAGLEIQTFMQTLKAEKEAQGKESWEIRCGIHTGPLVAGVVGKKKFAYDIWGDTVNTSSRMESSGVVGRVNISGTTYELIKDFFICTHRGKIPAKNKGDVDMYLVEGPR